jgi:hypothetical protein
MDNVFKEGELVYANENPALELIIRRYVQRVYYCRVKDGLDQNDLVYFERELTRKG